MSQCAKGTNAMAYILKRKSRVPSNKVSFLGGYCLSDNQLCTPMALLAYLRTRFLTSYEHIEHGNDGGMTTEHVISTSPHT